MKNFLKTILLIGVLLISNSSCSFGDYLPFCLFYPMFIPSMKTQTKVKVDWNQMYGSWNEILRTNTLLEGKDDVCPIESYFKTDEGYIKNTFTWHNADRSKTTT